MYRILVKSDDGLVFLGKSDRDGVAANAAEVSWVHVAAIRPANVDD